MLRTRLSATVYQANEAKQKWIIAGGCYPSRTQIDIQTRVSSRCFVLESMKATQCIVGPFTSVASSSVLSGRDGCLGRNAPGALIDKFNPIWDRIAFVDKLPTKVISSPKVKATQGHIPAVVTYSTHKASTERRDSPCIFLCRCFLRPIGSSEGIKIGHRSHPAADFQSAPRC